MGCEGESAARPAAPAPPTGANAAPAEGAPEIRVVTVARRPWPAVVRVQGSLWGDEEAIVGTKAQGQVRQVDAEMGTMVKRGQKLASLDPEEFDLKVDQAQAQLKQVRAKLGLGPDDPDESLDPLKAPTVRQETALLAEAASKLERAKSLYRQRAVSIEELQQLEAAHAAAVARRDSAINGVEENIALLGVRRTELGLALEQRENSVIVAPFEGVVRQRHVAPGVYVRVGSPVVALVRTDPLRLRAGVSEREATRIAVGQRVLVYVDQQEKPIEATVTRISPSLDIASRALAVEVDIPNPEARLRAGLFAEARIVVGPDEKALAVPADAVTEFAGVEKVWLVQDGQAREVTVTTGRRDHGLIEILSGVKPGDQVALEGRLARAGPVRIHALEAEPAAQLSE